MRGTLAVLLALFALQAGCGERSGPRQFFSIGTGGTGGIYYPLGGAVASRLSVADPSRQYTAEVTGGSVENVNRILQGQIDLGFTLAVTAYQAHNGSEDFPEPAAGLRIVAPLYPNVTHILVPGASTAESLADLEGKRVSVGSAGSGTEQVSRQLLEMHGLAYGDIEPRYLTFTESSAALRDGAIDAAIFSVGYPAAAVLEATTTGDVRLLGIDGERAGAIRKRYPYYSAGEIPPGAYPGVEEPIPTVAMMNWLVADQGLDGEVVTQLLNILAEDRVSLEQVHDMAAQVELDRLAEAPIPLHPAAHDFMERRDGQEDE